VARNASSGEAEQRRDVAVRSSGSVATSATSVGLCNGRAGALARRETAATLLTVGVGAAQLEHGELARLGRATGRSVVSRSGGSWWRCRSRGRREGDAVKLSGKCSGSLDSRVLEVGVYVASNAGSGEAKQRCDVAVGSSGSVATSTRAVGLRNGRAGALARRETAATLLAVRVGGAGAENDLIAAAGRSELGRELVGNRDGDEGERDEGSRELHGRG